MHKNFKILGAVAVAGVVAATGSAFTAAGDGVDDHTASYESAGVTGVSVTNIEYVLHATDTSKLDSIVFTVTTDVFTAAHEATLTLNPGVTETASGCTIVSATSISCPTAANVADVDGVALTVVAV